MLSDPHLPPRFAFFVVPLQLILDYLRAMIHNIDCRLQKFVAELPVLDGNHSLKREKRPFIRTLAGSSADG